jgi:hypothetical protein
MPLFDHRSVAITTTPARIIATSTRRTLQYLILRAALANSATIFVGASASVNGTNGDINCGWPLRPGEVKEIPINESIDPGDETDVWAVAASGTQYVHVEYK